MAGSDDDPEDRRGTGYRIAALVVAALIAGGVTVVIASRGPSTVRSRALTRLSPPPGVVGPNPPLTGSRAEPPMPDPIPFAAAPAVTPAAGSGQPAGGGPVPGDAGEPPQPPTPATVTTALTVRFHPSTRWDGGMFGYFAITNTTGLAVTGWRLVVTVPADLVVTATWEATMHRVGNTVTFTSTTTSERLSVGATIRFGLQVNIGRSYAGPENCVINGAACA